MKSNHLDIDSINTTKMFWTAITHKATFASTWRLFSSAMTEFFIPQFQTIWRLSKRPVVSVDHPLDETIPFRPEYIHTYLDFYPMWIKCMYFLYREFGDRSLPRIRDFMNEVADIYYEAGTIYRQCQSTTKRPKYLKHPKFALIHMVDPHLHCVPSLHVLIVALNYWRMSQNIDALAEDPSRYVEQKQYAYDQAVKITNSILFLKQHSVNCIPAALCVMSRHCPDYTEGEAKSFIDDLLLEEPLDDGAEIKKFIHTQYLRFMDQSAETCYKDVLLEFLGTCQVVSR